MESLNIVYVFTGIAAAASSEAAASARDSMALLLSLLLLFLLPNRLPNTIFNRLLLSTLNLVSVEYSPKPSQNWPNSRAQTLNIPTYPTRDDDNDENDDIF